MKMHAVFSDHMVLQANKLLRLFGSGNGNIAVSFDDEAAARFAVSGDWTVTLPARPYGGPHTLTVSAENETCTYRDVYFGDVLLLAGQSNMQFKLSGSSFPPVLYVENPLVRFFALHRPEEGEPFSAADGWVPCTKANAGNFSALGYHLAQFLQQATGHAVGCIACYQGASIIQAWLPPDAHIVDSHALDAVNFSWNGNSVLYERMFRKLPPISLYAAVWYQGESNAQDRTGDEENYSLMLRELVTKWRRDLQDEKLYFHIVELADYDGREPNYPYWDAVRQAQNLVAATVPRCAVIPCRDVCESDDIHPKTKIRLAARLAEKLLEQDNT